ncbi:hypothetical protein Purlil1_3797 [Purpureocillium lilacinum]|uniref:Uncharacterized protein n=1 Tax=Purpureocillium lilacinum TaxID=33203 RepID=A0ABR0C7L7_PURLI|nr:hypothetical protein Purlil1_3797 [Purpureocillium lilacinum]
MQAATTATGGTAGTRGKTGARATRCWIHGSGGVQCNAGLQAAATPAQSDADCHASQIGQSRNSQARTRCRLSPFPRAFSTRVGALAAAAATTTSTKGAELNCLKLASTGPVIPSRGLLLAKVIIRKERPAAARSSARFVIPHCTCHWKQAGVEMDILGNHDQPQTGAKTPGAEQIPQLPPVTPTLFKSWRAVETEKCRPHIIIPRRRLGRASHKGSHTHPARARTTRRRRPGATGTPFSSRWTMSALSDADACNNKPTPLSPLPSCQNHPPFLSLPNLPLRRSIASATIGTLWTSISPLLSQQPFSRSSTPFRVSSLPYSTLQGSFHSGLVRGVAHMLAATAAASVAPTELPFPFNIGPLLGLSGFDSAAAMAAWLILDAPPGPGPLP